MTSLPKRIERLKRKLGVRTSDAELAHRLGLSSGTLWNIRYANHKARQGTINKINDLERELGIK